MAPFLSFTAEEAWTVLGNGKSIFDNTYLQLSEPDADLLAKWARIRELREAVNKEIEVLRSQGQVGSSLQAQVQLTLNATDHALLQSLGEDVRFVFITSANAHGTGQPFAPRQVRTLLALPGGCGPSGGPPPPVPALRQ
jgi:isoleucyl-tRNA synthetase